MTGFVKNKKQAAKSTASSIFPQRMQQLTKRLVRGVQKQSTRAEYNPRFQHYLNMDDLHQQLCEQEF
jgi:hypothetical protein